MTKRLAVTPITWGPVGASLSVLPASIMLRCRAQKFWPHKELSSFAGKDPVSVTSVTGGENAVSYPWMAALIRVIEGRKP